MLASFVPPMVIRRATAGEPPTVPFGDRFAAAALFADISGFTALTERLAQEGAAGVEELTRVLNPWFARLVDGAIDHGGEVVKFAGDALIALWPAPPDALGLAVARAGRCALSVQAAFAEMGQKSANPLKLKVSIGAGEIAAAHLGGLRNRRELVVAGLPLVQVGAANEQAQPGDTVLSPEARALAGDLARGEVLASGALKLASMAEVRAVNAETPAIDTPAAEAALVAYVPGAIRTRLSAGQSGWLAELRRITVLFVNLADLDHQTPLDRAQAVMLGLQETLYKFEGSVNKISVDDKGVTLVAVFGLPPLSHEDDAARGVQAALELSSRLLALGMRNAIGVTTGRAFCGIVGSERRREYTVMGDVVNLAARLMQAAKGGDVLCDPATAGGARGRVAFDELPGLKVKGKAAKVAVFRPREEEITSTGTSHRRVQKRRAIVGRRAERLALADALDALATGGAVPAGICIEGGAGIGKSRLVAELSDQARARGIALYTGCAEGILHAPYFAWREICVQLLGLETLPTEKALARIDSALQPLLPLLNDVLPLGLAENELTSQLAGEARADNTRKLVVGLLRSAAARGPVLVVLEDAHHLDSASWSLLLAARREVERLLPAVAMRPPGDAAPPELRRFTGAPGLLHLVLEPLTAEQIVEVACRRLSVKALPEAAASLISAKAQGNPFYAEELAAALLEAGELQIAAGECRLREEGALRAIRLPDTVEGLITSRIDRLPPPDQLAAKAASVVGRTFTADLVGEIYPLQAERAHVPAYLERLERAGLAARDRPGAPTYAFAEAITQEVVYNLMPFAQRRELHRVLAEGIERANAHDLSACYGLLAHHYGRAEKADKTKSYTALAGEQAVNCHANREAIAWVSTAIALAEREGSADKLALARWTRMLGAAHFALGAMTESEALCRSALALLGLPKPVGRAAAALSFFGQALVQVAHRLWPRRFLGRRPLQRERLLEAVRAHERLCEIHYFAQETLPGLESTLSTLNLSEDAGPSPELARAYGNAALACSAVPLRRLAKLYADRARQLAPAGSPAATRAYVLQVTAASDGAVGAFAAMQEALVEGAAIARRAGDSRRADECTALLAIAAHLTGRLRESMRLYEEVLASAQSRGDPQAQAWALLGQARSAIRLGDFDEAERLTRLARPLFGERDDRSAWLQANAFTARIALFRGRIDDAAENASRVLEAIAPRRPTTFYGGHIPAAAAETLLAALEAGRSDLRGAAARACAALSRFGRIFPIGAPAALLCEGRLAELDGSFGRARRRHARSLRAARRLAMPYEEALAHERLGNLLRGPARREHLEASRSIFASLGAVADLARVRDALGESPGAGIAAALSP